MTPLNYVILSFAEFNHIIYRYRRFTQLHRLTIFLNFSQFVVKRLLCMILPFFKYVRHPRGPFTRLAIRARRTRINRKGTWVVWPGRTRNRIVRISRLYGRNGSCCGYSNLRQDCFYRWKMRFTNMHRNYRAYNESFPRTSRSILCRYFLRLIDRDIRLY